MTPATKPTTAMMTQQQRNKYRANKDKDSDNSISGGTGYNGSDDDKQQWQKQEHHHKQLQSGTKARSNPYRMSAFVLFCVSRDGSVNHRR
jgi:hypothetical protein